MMQGPKKKWRLMKSNDFGFAFAGEGSATLSGFDFAGGMMITIR